jgi:hypothetical protein
MEFSIRKISARKTADVANALREYDPDKTWAKVE